MDDQEKTLKYLISVEKLAESIISDKQEIILMDKRRNENREALRHTRNSSKSCVLTIGTNLVKCPKEKTVELLENDQKQLDIEINKMRSDLKVKVNELRDLEHEPPVPGLMLTPLSNLESLAFRKSGLYD